MKFEKTPIDGAWLVSLDRREDDRGFFARSYCPHEFAANGIDFRIAQANVAGNHRRGTLRGMHYSGAPSVEAKLVRCERGAIFDALVDVRPDSPTFLKSFSVELSGQNGLALYVPPLVGHGYLTLTDDVIVNYLVSDFYRAELERGFRYDDPACRIDWPFTPSLVSAKDLAWPALRVG